MLDDSQDADPLDSFYYVNWDDPIYDNFDEFGQVLSETEEAVTSASETSQEDSKSSIHVTYRDHHPKRPETKSKEKGPKVNEFAKKCDPQQCRLPDCR